MKSFSHKGLLKLLVLVVAFATAGRAMAQDAPLAKLYIPDFSLQSYDPKEVSVVLENSVDIAAFNFDLVLPEGLTLAGKPVFTDRKANGMTVEYNPDLNRIGVFSLMNYPFKGNEGAVLKMTFNIADGVLDSTEPLELKMTNISISGPSGDPDIAPADQTTVITFEAGEFKVTASEEPVAIIPGKASELTIGLENSADVAGIQFNITLPEGITVDEESFVQSSRCSENTMIVPFVRDNGVVNVQMMDLSGGNIIEGTTEGSLVSFKINVPADYTELTSEVLIDEVIVSALGNQSFEAGTVTITLQNDLEKYQAAMADVEALRASLAAALETIATEAPDVKDNFTGDAITAEIDALEEAIETAYSEGTLGSNYDEIMAPGATIEDAIAKLIEDAKAAQLNFTKHAEALAEVEALRASLAAALETIATEAPDVKDDFTGDAITAMIDGLEQAIETAFAEGSLGTDYETVMEPVESIEAAIEALIAEAKAAQEAKEESDRQAANDALYQADLAALDALEAQLNAVLAEIASDYPDYNPTAESSAIQAQISAARSAAHAEHMRVQTPGTGTYISQVDSEAITAMITEMLNNAKSAGIEDLIVKAENGEIMIYTIDGKKVASPVSGQLNIFVDKEGNTFKKFVR